MRLICLAMVMFTTERVMRPVLLNSFFGGGLFIPNESLVVCINDYYSVLLLLLF